MANYQFHHMHLICSDLDEVQDFFTQVLGAEFVDRKMFGDVEGAIVDLSGTQIYLRRPREGEAVGARPDATYYGYDHFGLVVDDLDAAYQQLQDSGYTFTVPPRGTAGRIAFFTGPDGIQVELFQPPD
jgi:catechol 2,3-dioxygenase-like lactoylglutathione lyase family enzyme